MERSAIVESIGSAGADIAVLHAPAGFGKSALLEELHADHLASGRAATLSGAFDGAALPALLEGIADLSTPPGWILLDDPATDAVDAVRLARAAQRLGESGHGIVIATRDIATLPLARLRAERRVIIHGPDQLRLARRDVIQTHARIFGTKKADRLAGFADGWPVAVGLISDWMQASGEGPDDDGHFLDPSGLSAYIEQEVLGPLPEPWRRALLFAALFERCDRKLLDATRPEEDLGRHLPDILAAIPGLMAHEAGQFSFHPLLRLHLRRMFERLPFDQRESALERASTACARAGRLPESADLITRVGRQDAISDYLRRSRGLRLWMIAGSDTIRQLVERGEANGAIDDPRLKLLKCIIHLKDGLVADAERLLAEALPMLSGDELAIRDAEVVRTTLLIYGCRRSTLDDMRRFGEVVLQDGDDPAWRALLMTMQCILHSQQGQFDLATAYASECETASRIARSYYNLMFLEIHRATIALARGELVQARAHVSEARRSWRLNYRDDVGVETVLGALGASLEFETGRLTSARAHVRKSSQRMPHAEAWLDIYAYGYEPMVRLSMDEVGLAPTLTILATQQDRLRSQGLGRVANLLGAIGVCLRGEAWLRGPLPRASDAPAIDEWPDEGASWHEREMFGLADAYRALEAGEEERARIALDQLLDFAREHGIRRSELRALLLLTETLDRLGQGERADRCFAEALVIAAETGMSRALAEFGAQGIASRVRRALADREGFAASGSQTAGLARSLARWFRDAEPSTTSLALTPREREVLLALDQGGSDKLIGRRLGVTEHAVRYHLKNLYRKLKVHDRVLALNRARAIGEL